MAMEIEISRHHHRRPVQVAASEKMLKTSQVTVVTRKMRYERPTFLLHPELQSVRYTDQEGVIDACFMWPLSLVSNRYHTLQTKTCRMVTKVRTWSRATSGGIGEVDVTRVCLIFLCHV